MTVARRGQQIAQPLAGFLRAVFLKKREQSVEEDDDEDGESELRHAREDRQPAGNPEHDREEVHELGEKAPPQRHVRRERKEIRAVGVPALFDVVAAQARHAGLRGGIAIAGGRAWRHRHRHRV